MFDDLEGFPQLSDIISKQLRVCDILEKQETIRGKVCRTVTRMEIMIMVMVLISL